MKILKYLIVIGIVMQILLLSGCDENRSNTTKSEFIDSNLSESDVDDSNLSESYVDAVDACENEDSEACFKAGQIYSSEAYKELDYDRDQAAEKVAQFYLKSCELGFAQGCTAYGMNYTSDSQRDTNKDAKFYFEKGCEGGDTAGCTLFQMAP